ncbi:MAG: thiamine-phosphate kinase [Candidatus Gastranaerophilales bacterium]
MKEKEFINLIKNMLNSNYIGDDCAYLKELGIVITQDSLVEDVHFSTNFTTPYELGYKSVMVNLSDIYASGAEAKYLTISLSLPSHIETNFIKEFYTGAKEACQNEVEIVGGDLTSGDKIFISITAIGTDKNRMISSRADAKIGDKIIVSGEHGSSAGGLKLLQQNNRNNLKLLKAHLMPSAKKEFSKQISTQIKRNYAMTDSSDGLIDAISQIAQQSQKTMSLDFEKIPYNHDIKIFENYKDLIFYGGEDYELVATVPENFLKHLQDYTVIGEVQEKKDNVLVKINNDDKTEFLKQKDIDDKLYQHFKG